MDMAIGQPKSLSECKRFFCQPSSAKQRQYEALRAYFAEGRSSAEAARAFGYTTGSFQVMCHRFRREKNPSFFLMPKPGPRSQPKKSAARDLIVKMRKTNHSVYEISEILKSHGKPLSPTAVREVLKVEGFAALPRRLDEERPDGLRPTIEAVADVRQPLSPLAASRPCAAACSCCSWPRRSRPRGPRRGSGPPGSKMIPGSHALRSMLALKLWSIERRSHVMPHVADQGLSLLAGLNAIPKRSFLSEYSSRVGHHQIVKLQAAYHKQIDSQALFPGESFNLDFHSIPYFGEHPGVQCHFLAMRSRRQKCVLTFLAQESTVARFRYSNADIRKGEESEEIFRFVAFWKRVHGEQPHHLVFDSKLTTLANLARLDKMNIIFMTLRARSPKLKKEVALMPASAWREIEPDVPTRKYRFQEFTSSPCGSRSGTSARCSSRSRT